MFYIPNANASALRENTSVLPDAPVVWEPVKTTAAWRVLLAQGVRRSARWNLRLARVIDPCSPQTA